MDLRCKFEKRGGGIRKGAVGSVKGSRECMGRGSREQERCT